MWWNNSIPRWYYSYNGIRKGPSSLEVVKQEIESGNISANTLVWTEGFSEWKQAKDTELNQFIVRTVPPMVPSEISDKWAWALATIPIIVYMLLLGLGLGEVALTLIILILNCGFLFVDISNLKKSGANPGNWVYLGLLLVPVYLFIRAAKTTKKYEYAIVWCVLYFVLELSDL